MQFNHVQSAAKAIHYANMKALLNRTIVVDWAVPKSKFSNTNVDESDIKSEKIEPIDQDEVQDTTLRISSDDEDKSEDLNAESNRLFKNINCGWLNFIHIL